MSRGGVRPGSFSWRNVAHCASASNSIFLARFHEEATTSGDCGDAGARHAVAACADRHDPSATTTDQDEEGEGRPSEEGRSPEQKAIRELQDKMAAQQAEIDQLKQQNAAKDAALSAAQSTASTPRSPRRPPPTAQAQSAAAAAQSQAEAVTGLKSTVADLQNTNARLVESISTTKQDLNERSTRRQLSATRASPSRRAASSRLKVCTASVP
jgi:uncharacterized small protein (DUF1192 family)